MAALAWTQPAGPAAFAAPAAPAAPAPQAGAPIVFEPVVMFDVTGTTFAGTVHEHMTVYNNGFVTISKRNDNPFGNLQIDVQTADVGAAAASQLLGNLISAGVTTLPDQAVGAADLPLSTLTVLQGKQQALSRTFSYWAATNQYAAVSSVINGFKTSTFPGF